MTVARPLVCAECDRSSDLSAAGWHGYLIGDEDTDADQMVFFCPVCVEREFRPDSDGRALRS